MQQQLNMPATVRGFFAGTAAAYQTSLASEPLLIGTALLAVYIVLGILYESLVHPLTIISTLPSASVGAMLALMLFKIDLNVISIIGIILLIGIVKKNAIMMIDFALVAEREHGKTTTEAIFEACQLRFRPILMTTMAALFGALPLAFGTGTGSELRRPLGITIVGGLIVSQMLTLYTTPVVYLFFDRLRLRFQGKQPATLYAMEPPRPPSEGWFWSACYEEVDHAIRKPDRGLVRARYRRSLYHCWLDATWGQSIFRQRRPRLRPSKSLLTQFKESDGWTVAQPQDAALRGKWWEIYNEPELNSLEDQLNIDNQNIQQAFENFMEARALVREARSQYFPTVSIGGSYTRSQTSSNHRVCIVTTGGTRR